MANPLFNMMGGGMGNLGDMGNLIQQFQQFKNSFRGNPQEQVQQLLNSGRVSQEQYNDAVKKAQALMNLLK